VDLDPSDTDMVEIKPAELCDVCGAEVDPAEAVKAELAAANAMCPTPMTFHPHCYEQASAIWEPDPDSYCTTDPEFPETAQWTTP